MRPYFSSSLKTQSQRDAERFATIDGRLTAAWDMLDGNVMTGEFIRSCISQDAITVIRPDGTTCHVPTDKLRPATCDDVEAACRFFAQIGK